MKIWLSFGGGPRNDRDRRNRNRNRNRRYDPSVNVSLGPVGSAIVSVFIILMGVFTLFIGMNSIIMILIGVFLIVIGVVVFRSNVKGKNNE